eukprot:6194484-Alexandrium_andersonii.AAC.1
MRAREKGAPGRSARSHCTSPGTASIQQNGHIAKWSKLASANSARGLSDRVQAPVGARRVCKYC